MMIPAASPMHQLEFDASRLAQLQQLITVRAILIIVLLGVYLALLYSGTISIDHIPIAALAGPIAALTLFNFYSYWQLNQSKPLTHLGMFAQLAADIAALSIVLYFTGGSTNPFVSYFLVPITLSAVALPAFYTAALIILTALIYYTQFYYFLPFSLFSDPHAHMHHSTSNAHFIGMWINFVFSACLIGFFVFRLQKIINQKNRDLREAQVQLHRNEQLFALGTMAAGTAHQLGTPLNTMLILAQDLENDGNLSDSARDDIRIIKSQIESCKAVLQNLKQTESALAPSVVELNSYLDELISSINIVRPETLIEFEENNDLPINIRRDITLDQAIINLLNNALDASTPNTINVDVKLEDNAAVILIKQMRNTHSEPPPQSIGAKPFSTKSEGIGIGIMLTFSSLDRLGGKAVFLSDEKNIITKITLPLAS